MDFYETDDIFIEAKLEPRQSNERPSFRRRRIFLLAEHSTESSSAPSKCKDLIWGMGKSQYLRDTLV